MRRESCDRNRKSCPIYQHRKKIRAITGAIGSTALRLLAGTGQFFLSAIAPPETFSTIPQPIVRSPSRLEADFRLAKGLTKFTGSSEPASIHWLEKTAIVVTVRERNALTLNQSEKKPP